MKGTFYGVGVGPGDPRLMTILAVETIRSCPVVAVPLHGYERGVAYQIARGMIDDLDAKECVGFRVPMSKDRNILTEAYQRAAADIIEKLREGIRRFTVVTSIFIASCRRAASIRKSSAEYRPSAR